MRTIVFGVLLLLQSFDIKASNRAIVLGGSCEVDQDRSGNMLQNNIADISNGLKKRGWKVSVLYDGDNSRCSANGTPRNCPEGKNPSIWSVDHLANQLNSKPAEIGSNTRKEIFENLKKEIEIAKLTKEKNPEEKQQVFISIQTHGSPKEEGSEHSICVSDGLKTSKMSVAELRPYLEELKAAGVKIGLEDGSCYSGGSVDVLGDLGCVVSSQSSTRYTYDEGSTSKALANYLNDSSKKVLSLEDVFMSGLLNDAIDTGNTYHQPKISNFENGNNEADEITRILSPAQFDETVKSIADDSKFNRCDVIIKGLDETERFANENLNNLDLYWAQTGVERYAKKSVPLPKELLSKIKSEVEEYRDLFGKYQKFQNEEKETLEKFNKLQLNVKLPVFTNESDKKYLEGFIKAMDNPNSDGKSMILNGNEARFFMANNLDFVLKRVSDKNSKEAFLKIYENIKQSFNESTFKKSYEEIDQSVNKIRSEKLSIQVDRDEVKDGPGIKIFSLKIPTFDRIQTLKASLNRHIAQARAYAYIAQKNSKKIPSDCVDFRF